MGGGGSQRYEQADQKVLGTLRDSLGQGMWVFLLFWEHSSGNNWQSLQAGQVASHQQRIWAAAKGTTGVNCD